MGWFLYLGEHRRLALAHENFEIEIPLGRGFRPHQIHDAFAFARAVPHAERTGPVVKGSYGLPVRADMYRRWFRQIARAAGIPHDVWNMDSRAGGATEADEAGAALETIQALTHTKPSTTVRYLRRGSSKKISQVADARSQARTREGGEKPR